MVGEATRRRRGREVRHRREHQVHPPRSHPKADTQVTNLNNASSTNCHPSLPTTTNIREKSGSRRSRFFFSSPLHSQPRPSQSRGCHGFHRAHDPAHLRHAEDRGGAYPVHYGDVSLLLVRERGLSLPAWLKAHSPGCKPQPKGAWLSPTCSWLESEARGANARARGSCQVTDESLAMILTMSLDD